jgi:hypothetical protein
MVAGNPDRLAQVDVVVTAESLGSAEVEAKRARGEGIRAAPDRRGRVE